MVWRASNDLSTIEARPNLKSQRKSVFKAQFGIITSIILVSWLVIDFKFCLCDLPPHWDAWSFISPEALKDLEFQSDLHDFAIHNWEPPNTSSFPHPSPNNEDDLKLVGKERQMFLEENKNALELPNASSSSHLSHGENHLSPSNEDELELVGKDLEGNQSELELLNTSSSSYLSHSEKDDLKHIIFNQGNYCLTEETEQLVRQSHSIAHVELPPAITFNGKPSSSHLSPGEKDDPEHVNKKNRVLKETERPVWKRKKIAQVEPLLGYQTLFRDRIINPEKVRGTYKKRKKAEDTDPGPPYSFVDHEPTSDTAQLVILRAIKSLRQADRSKIIDAAIVENRHKEILQIRTNQIKRFLASFRSLDEDGLGLMDKLTTKNSEPSRRGNYKDRHRLALKNFNQIGPQARFRNLYVRHVIPDFEESMSDIEREITEGISERRIKHGMLDFQNMVDIKKGVIIRSNTESVAPSRAPSRKRHQLLYYERLARIFNYYLLYVDIINTLIPDGDISNQDWRTSQRRLAGHEFLQDARQLVRSYGEALDRSRTPEGRYQMTRADKKYFESMTDHSSVIWKSVAKWIKSSRKSLAIEITNPKDSKKPIRKHFKQFVNEIYVSFLDDITNHYQS
jgi:hypothetical protein